MMRSISKFFEQKRVYACVATQLPNRAKEVYVCQKYESPREYMMRDRTKDAPLTKVVTLQGPHQLDYLKLFNEFNLNFMIKKE